MRTSNDDVTFRSLIAMTIQPCGLENASARTPRGTPVTSCRTAPGRTKRLKLAKTQNRFVNETAWLPSARKFGS